MSLPLPKNTTVKKASWLYKLGLRRRPYNMSCDYRGDGLGVKGKSLKFLEDEKFNAAWDRTAGRVHETTGQPAPDIRWRAHMAIWAARRGLGIEGDFVECGVFAGTLAMMICDYLGFASAPKKFYLFDTWEGVPTEGISGREAKTAAANNESYYHRRDVFDAVKQSFAPWPNCKLVRGMLPGTLEQAGIEKVAYLSVDLNNSTYEKACIEWLWPKLSPGACVVIDDYGWKAYRAQQDMWDAFAASHNLMIATLPTGQGLLIKP